MSGNKLILFSRVGCCLCKGLEEHLGSLPLTKLNPPLKLYVKDIDGLDVSSVENSRYSLEVPVLLLELEHPLRRLELPRVSPRLSEEELFKWLQKRLQKTLE